MTIISSIFNPILNSCSLIPEIHIFFHQFKTTNYLNISINHSLLTFSRYEASDNFLGDIDCQKRAICEIYQNPLEMGELNIRAKHSLDMLESASLMSLPDEFMNLVDEFLVREFLQNTMVRKLIFISF